MLKWIKRLAFALLILCAMLLLLFYFHAPLLQKLAAAWIVNDPLARADLIVVLGGGPETRPFEAAKLLNQGLASKILLMNPKPTEAFRLGLIPTEANLDRLMLLKKNVSDAHISIAPETVSSTYEESLAVRDWSRTNHVQKIIVVTDVFHSRRARWLFKKRLNPMGILVSVDAVPVREYTLQDWWRHEQGIIAFQNELLKYAYYRVKY